MLNLIVTQSLFTQRDSVLDEGTMAKILSGLVSNRALDTQAHKPDKRAFSRLIPRSIGGT